jgi:hypothetical protein
MGVVMTPVSSIIVACHVLAGATENQLFLDDANGG